MKRREAMKNVALIFGSALSVSTLTVFQQGCTRSKDAATGVFTAEDAQLMSEIGDIIIPDTPDSPGAKAAGVGPLMVTLLEDCYSQEDREKVSAFLVHIENEKDFSGLAAGEQVSLVAEIDAKVYSKGNDLEEALTRGYKIVKELTLFGYFSSEIGATQALRYKLVPGRYDGCVDYHPGDKAWA
ncbi:gluconate 2-dehydrogenase subunit 3 family protein [Echinicola marina]|uniref:gluconate 2-dehydrogenase subunit 3 family protein n=1 Tax=Echinicola marina TaxID=2859768 RepID=UPI001CF66D8F|nr:gluconate 2-dehydrogenase subunit 3 family protein [Echinicola marina]UCS94758.1 gluconate 2-dehydrogenase subunit 3 family protein [Echinicola marina]